MQAVNRDTDLILQAQQLLHDADARGIQTLDVLGKSFSPNNQSSLEMFVCI